MKDPDMMNANLGATIIVASGVYTFVRENVLNKSQ